MHLEGHHRNDNTAWLNIAWRDITYSLMVLSMYPYLYELLSNCTSVYLKDTTNQSLSIIQPLVEQEDGK